MEKKEIIEIMATLKAAYSNSFKGMTDADKMAMINLWHRQFIDYDYKTVLMAVDSIISSDTREFVPPIAVVKDMIIKLTTEEQMTAAEAWVMLKGALRNSGYHAADEFEKLPPLIQRIVGSPRQLYDWSMMPTDTVDSVVSSNFMRSYNAIAKKEKEFIAIPMQVKKALGIDTLATQMRIASAVAAPSLESNNFSDMNRIIANMIAVGNISSLEMESIKQFVNDYANQHCYLEIDVMNSLLDELKRGKTKQDIFKCIKEFEKNRF